jgi:hypothetical protein
VGTSKSAAMPISKDSSWLVMPSIIIRLLRRADVLWFGFSYPSCS